MNSTRPIEPIHPVPLALGGSIAMASAMGIGRFVYTPILPEMAAALHLSASQAGLIASANFAGYLLGALVATASQFARRRRFWMLAALAVSALSTGAMAASSSVTPFLILRFIGGAASALVLVLASSLVLDRLAATGRSQLSALHFAGVGGGIVLSAVIVAALGSVDVGWQGQWIGVAVLSLVAVAAAAFLVPRAEPSLAQARAAQRRKLGAPLIALTIAYGLFGFGYVITATFLVQIVRTSSEIAPLEPVIWVIVGAAATPSIAFWSAVARRIGTGAAYALASVVQALGVLASVLWIAPAGVILASVLLGGTIMGLTALGLMGGRKLATGDAARIVALMTAVFGIGQIAGPVFAGWLHDRTGSFSAPSVAAAGGLLLAALLVWRVTAPALR